MVTFTDELRSARLLAIVRGHKPDAVRASVLTLFEAGVRLVEVSLTGRSALAVLTKLMPDVPAGCLLGAGTVRTEGDVQRVRDAGVHFAVSPSVTDSVPVAVSAGLPVLAGALTPTEIETALGFGADAVKIFPASLGGPGYLAALRQPYPDVPMVPVGGVGRAEAVDYLAKGAIAVGVGSPLVRDAAEGGDLGELAARARDFLEAVAA
ncbi:MAG TPA: bifunctional 4-hydroxy-2-oxoglutarate aldolase/2-dehydro-3-deoxy-phosphogluconate aldolase [Pseudonocardiaceae bacterium]|jgi:2-dehydro-3-deoxyphosphogluconate aldolase/(4S)-4-hydroxy-2-oxoglutarate aldolase|nr:bifunctional 4-hydroxy-2-oxoglutarate aldolase/2-dehydro-3-deoxy-phosphogluconate aldolase [Pseudonocardiaceae bacterium]